MNPDWKKIELTSKQKKAVRDCNVTIFVNSENGRKQKLQERSQGNTKTFERTSRLPRIRY